MHWIARLQNCSELILPDINRILLSSHSNETQSTFNFPRDQTRHASTYLKEGDHCVNKSKQCSFTWENYMEVIESPSLKQDSGNWQEKCNCSFSKLNSTENRSFYHLVSASVFPLMWGDTWIEWLCKRGEFMKEHDAMWHLAALAGISSGKRMAVMPTPKSPTHPRVSPRRKTKDGNV